jgi:hypothetical protein
MEREAAARPAAATPTIRSCSKAIVSGVEDAITPTDLGIRPKGRLPDPVPYAFRPATPPSVRRAEQREHLLYIRRRALCLMRQGKTHPVLINDWRQSTIKLLRLGVRASFPFDRPRLRLRARRPRVRRRRTQRQTRAGPHADADGGSSPILTASIPEGRLSWWL